MEPDWMPRLNLGFSTMPSESTSNGPIWTLVLPVSDESTTIPRFSRELQHPITENAVIRRATFGTWNNNWSPQPAAKWVKSWWLLLVAACVAWCVCAYARDTCMDSQDMRRGINTDEASSIIESIKHNLHRRNNKWTFACKKCMRWFRWYIHKNVDKLTYANTFAHTQNKCHCLRLLLKSAMHRSTARSQGT